MSNPHEFLPNVASSLSNNDIFFSLWAAKDLVEQTKYFAKKGIKFVPEAGPDIQWEKTIRLVKKELPFPRCIKAIKYLARMDAFPRESHQRIAAFMSNDLDRRGKILKAISRTNFDLGRRPSGHITVTTISERDVFVNLEISHLFSHRTFCVIIDKHGSVHVCSTEPLALTIEPDCHIGSLYTWVFIDISPGEKVSQMVVMNNVSRGKVEVNGEVFQLDDKDTLFDRGMCDVNLCDDNHLVINGYGGSLTTTYTPRK